jgi:hypothetical protein
MGWLKVLGRVRWWKVLGVAGIAGVAATGVVIIRSERKRRAYTPDQIRTRLHERVGEASTKPQPDGDASS